LSKTVRPNGSGDLVFSKKYHADSEGEKNATDYGFFALPNVKEAEKQIEMLIGAYKAVQN
jgi:hypothetical protein